MSSWPSDAQSPERMSWVYEQLIRSEAHITDQIQNQQTRIGTTLATSGVVLGLIANGAFSSLRTFSSWERGLLVGAMGILVLGIAAGILALLPRVPIRLSAAYINVDWIRDRGAVLPGDELYVQLVESFDKQGPERALRRRRRLQQVQLVCLGLALLFTTVALGVHLT